MEDVSTCQAYENKFPWLQVKVFGVKKAFTYLLLIAVDDVSDIWKFLWKIDPEFKHGLRIKRAARNFKTFNVEFRTWTVF